MPFSRSGEAKKSASSLTFLLVAGAGLSRWRGFSSWRLGNGSKFPLLSAAASVRTYRFSSCPLKNKPTDERLVCFLVDYTGKISNFLEDLEKLDRFAQSVENELNRIVSAGEGSRKDP